MTHDWFDNDQFWQVFGQCMFHEDSFLEAQSQLHDLLACLDAPGRRLLDLGCGPGRFAVPLAMAGWNVTGLDLSQSLLQSGRQFAETSDASVEWVHGDMRSYSRPGAFDAVICMWTSFGYFDDVDDDQQVIAQSFANLTAGGRFLLDVAGKEIILRDLEPVHLTEYESGRILVERPMLTRDMGRYDNQWILIDGDQAHHYSWGHNLYSASELRRMLQTAGFVDVEAFGSLTGEPYDMDADRLIMVGTRPE